MAIPVSPARLACLAVLFLGATDASFARTIRRHHVRHYPPVAAPDPREAQDPRLDLEGRAAYVSGAAFGLFDLGISGTATAVSPYAPAGFGFRRPGYYGPGYGYPGY